MSERWRDRVLSSIGRIGRERPVLVAAVLIALLLAGLAAASQLRISTSRFDMIAEDNVYQSRMIRFFDEFGYPDAPIIIVEGGTVEARRDAVNHLLDRLEAEPLFAGRTLGKIGADEIAETLLVQQPGALAELRARLPPDVDLPAALERGLPGIFGLLEQQLYAALDGEVEVDRDKTDVGMKQLATLARALDRRLAADADPGAPRGRGYASEGALLDALGGDQAMPTVEELRARGLDPEGYLVSNDGEHLLIALLPEFGGDEVDDYGPVVERLRAIRAEVEPELGEVELVFTGLPFIAYDEAQVLGEGMLRASAAAALGIFLLLLVAFRSLRRTITALLPIGFGTVISLGAAFLIYDHLDPVTSSFAAVLMGLSIDFSVHLLSRYDEDLRRGAARGPAMSSALRAAGPGVVVGGVTTMLAFLTLAGSDFTSYGDMGVLTVIGLAASLLAAFTIIPMLLARDRRSGDHLERPEQDKDAPPSQLGLIELVPKAVRFAPVLTVALALVLALIGGASTPRYNPRYLDFLPPGAEATRGLELLEDDGAMTPWFAWVTAEDLDDARAKAERLRDKPTVARVDSPTDALPELAEAELTALRAGFEGIDRDPDFDALAARAPSTAELAAKTDSLIDAFDELIFALEQSGRETSSTETARLAFVNLRTRLETVDAETGAATLDEIEDDMAALLARAWTSARRVATRGGWTVDELPPIFSARFLARDGSGRVALYVFPAERIWEGGTANAMAQDFTRELESVDPHAAGQGVSLWYHNEMIVRDFQRALMLAAALVLVLLLIDFRRPKQGLLALFPVVIGAGWMIGLLNLFGFSFNAASIPAAPLVMGIGIDAGVHMMHRFDLSAREHGGKAKIDELVKGTGGAIILSFLTTMIGFAALLLGEHQGMSALGLAMVVGIGSCLLAAVVVLPALLLILRMAD